MSDSMTIAVTLKNKLGVNAYPYTQANLVKCNSDPEGTLDKVLDNKANTSDIPTDNSELANGAGYISTLGHALSQPEMDAIIMSQINL